MAEWVRYKLDRKIDHILVDEAQDTNDAQWNIIEALSDDFFSGAGAGKERPRTIFAVGDFKQAIYGFQGTAPEKYREAGNRLDKKIADTGELLHRQTLSQSFRSTRPVLDFVNAVLAGIGYETLGLDAPVSGHFSEKADHGTIELMRCVKGVSEADDEDKDDSEEQWLSEEKRKLAHKISQHVKNLIDAKPVLATTGLPLKPGDIMILLRARGELAALIVARLHTLGVPVAGIDRLRIVEPIAVQDLLAAIRFVLQPKDDLSLACLLVSPLIGWDQDKLLKYGYRDRHIDLWQHLRSQLDIENDLEPLRAMLRTADQTTPYSFLENILSGPIGGRRKFRARLGAETIVPIEELLNLAMQYQQEGGASLQGFVDWFDRGESEIKREGLVQSSDVRVMTVHGAKGLEAPVVLLADIASDPEQSNKRNNAVDLPMENDRYLPLLPIKQRDRSGGVEKVVGNKEKADMQEHYRLLYVAMTRASEHLVMAGSLGKRAKNGPPEKSWYAALEAGMTALGCDWQSDPLWGATMRYEATGTFARKDQGRSKPSAPVSIPDWLFQPAPVEENPPRPLAPSNLEDDLYGDAPAPENLKRAARRGKLIHSLFEQYDGRDITAFRDDALGWLMRTDRENTLEHRAIIDQVAAVLQNPDWVALFSKNARAEVPLAALVGTTVVSGRVDRLLIEPGLVRLVDFKTGRKVPVSENDVSVPQIRQMAYYVAALEAIFPGHKVEASLLYTAGPAMITLSNSVLAPHKPA
jgi:ATP-dependent helicase/nuclease subunit A